MVLVVREWVESGERVKKVGQRLSVSWVWLWGAVVVFWEAEVRQGSCWCVALRRVTTGVEETC